MNDDIQGLNIEDILEKIASLGEKKYRAKQIFQWIQEKNINNFEEMTNISKELRSHLGDFFEFFPLKIRRKLISKNDQTTKFLFELQDGELIETVLMSYLRKDTRDRNTVCVSSQVGCPMGCTFCATGLQGWKRNLTAGEIVAQILACQRELRVNNPDSNVTNVVFMGMGEPLLNLDNVLKAIHIINNPHGLNVGMRKISISTCGLVPQINKLADEKISVTLSISLHAPNNELRNKIMPVNKKYPLENLMEACRNYTHKTGRRITFEYTLIENQNDSLLHAKQLVDLMKGMLANVNLIPLNPVPESGLNRPNIDRVLNFLHFLEENGVTALLREEKGTDINAACGQLRSKEGQNL